MATANIANGASKSQGINLKDETLVGMMMPAAFTGTQITFETSTDGTTYDKVVRDKAGNIYTIAVGANQHITIPPADLYGIKYIKLVSNAAEGAARAIPLISRSV